jgi:8-oxo-dGTP pyrophosphatase MutT (NUDIX family)
MKKFVVGFLFSSDHKFVVLIEKKRPNWQQGFLNGIGGHIEYGETPNETMEREFEEETGCFINKKLWENFALLHNKEVEIYFFKSVTDFFDIKTTTDEEIGIYPIIDLPFLHVIPNLQWLIPLCFDEYNLFSDVQLKT